MHTITIYRRPHYNNKYVAVFNGMYFKKNGTFIRHLPVSDMKNQIVTTNSIREMISLLSVNFIIYKTNKPRIFKMKLKKGREKQKFLNYTLRTEPW